MASDPARDSSGGASSDRARVAAGGGAGPARRGAWNASSKGAPPSSPALVGSSDALRHFSAALARAADTDTTLLLVGESGTGKGLAARVLHASGPRCEGPLVRADLAALAPTLVEAALFGHERGAFTDAHRARPGLFRQADGGTLVLDDVDLLTGAVQGKLLRVLQERVVEPLGAEAPVPVDVRVVATTNRDLRREVDEGRFRLDLYYRLAVLELELPPLRARLDDLPELATFLVERVAERAGVAPRPLRPAALERLAGHPWPGNVRELENTLERVLVLGREGPIEPDELAFLDEAVAGVEDDLARRALAHGSTIDSLALAMMRRALEEERGNVSAAARRVGLTRRAFDYRLARAEDDGAEDSGEDPG